MMPQSPPITSAHLKRLRDYWRSAGWPVRDNLELDLLLGGLAELHRDPQGIETIRVSTAGIAALGSLLARNRAALDRHEALVRQVAAQLQRDGWMTFTGRSFKVKPDARWITVRPDVFALPRTLDERRIRPRVYEIKVSRADLKSDLRNAAKRQGYEQLSQQLWYVLPAEIARPADLDAIPDTCGVLLGDGHRLREHRPAPLRAEISLRPIHWLQLLASCRDAEAAEPAQRLLGEAAERTDTAALAAPDAAPDPFPLPVLP